jgi:hypothetical protein
MASYPGNPVTGPLTDLPVVAEANATDVLADLRAHGVDPANPDAVRHVQGGYQVLMEHVITMNALGQLTDDATEKVLTTIAGMHNAVRDAQHLVEHMRKQDAAQAARPAAPKAKEPRKIHGAVNKLFASLTE